ncbi:hypothetical protein [Nocardia farcinica]|uniref:hypothetical protein n=1 Tax=Nocardia farcinica TaxID=37329 RepID=UPI002453A345|nr:hypothetical protein [Nocardia farcinica]
MTALDPWLSPGLTPIANDPIPAEEAVWQAAAEEAKWRVYAPPELLETLQWPRKIWPDWVDVLNAVIALEWRKAGWVPPEDSFNPEVFR